MQCHVAVSCCSVMLQCLVAVSCCSVLMRCYVAVSLCGVVLQCLVAVSCCGVLFSEFPSEFPKGLIFEQWIVVCCTVLQCAAVHKLYSHEPLGIRGNLLNNTLQHTATYCNTVKCVSVDASADPAVPRALQHTAIHCNTLQHTATHWSAIVMKWKWRPRDIYMYMYIYIRILQYASYHFINFASSVDNLSIPIPFVAFSHQKIAASDIHDRSVALSFSMVPKIWRFDVLVHHDDVWTHTHSHTHVRSAHTRKSSKKQAQGPGLVGKSAGLYPFLTRI